MNQFDVSINIKCFDNSSNSHNPKKKINNTNNSLQQKVQRQHNIFNYTTTSTLHQQIKILIFKKKERQTNYLDFFE